MSGEADTAARRIVFLNRRAPHGSIHAQEALEVVLVGAAFDQRVRLVFMDDGVYQLKRGQDTAALGVKDFARAYRALEQYEPERVVVEEASLTARGLGAADLMIDVEIIDSDAIARLLEDSDTVLEFLMPILHTVNRSPYRETTLDSCLRVALPGSALLLIEDGVYAALAAGEAAPRIREAQARMRVFALDADLRARGLGESDLVDDVQVVDYAGFVDLACEYDKVQSWV